MDYNTNEKSSWNYGQTDKFCMHCGAPIEDDFLFCQICGLKLQNSKAAQKKVQERKRRKKRILALTVSILLGLVIALYGLSFAATYSDYKDACKSLENGDFEDAYHKFVVLDGFMDSDEMIIETIYRNADELLTKGAYKDAMQQFSNISYYKDSETKVSDCKYAYVLANKNNDDDFTYAYISELKEQNYKNAAEVYDEIYKWRAKGIINNKKNDETTHCESISKYSSFVQFSFTLEGGLPGETVDLKYKVTYPDGSTFESKEFWSNQSEGETFGSEWSNGLHKNPEKTKTGTMTVELYNADTNELVGSVSTMVTN